MEEIIRESDEFEVCTEMSKEWWEQIVIVVVIIIKYENGVLKFYEKLK